MSRTGSSTHCAPAGSGQYLKPVPNCCGESTDRGPGGNKKAIPCQGFYRGGLGVKRLDLASVNWRDGMLVGSKHFLQQEQYHDEALSWILRHGMPLYGIVPSRAGTSPPLRIEAALESPTRLRVALLACKAVCPDGSIVDIDPDSETRGEHPVVGLAEIEERAEKVIPVYVRAQGAKVEAGVPEESGAKPWRVRQYELLLDESRVTHDGSALKVAELVVAEGKIAESEDFLPPALSMGATDGLRRRSEEIARLALRGMETIVGTLEAVPPAADAHPWVLAARTFLQHLASGWSVALENLVGWEKVPPPFFVGSLRSMLRVFGNTLRSLSPVRQTLDQEFLQAGGLPERAGGIGLHDSIAHYSTTPYQHGEMGRLITKGAELLEYAVQSVEFIAGKVASGAEAPAEAPRPKVTYRQQDYYLLGVGKIESSFSEDSQVLYFRDLETKTIRSVLFVLRNNAAEGTSERDIRLKGGVNDDRPLYCPDLQPDFKERPGRIFLLMEVERGKRDRVDYITLRSSGVIDLRELLQNKETDIKLYYL